MAKDPDDPTRFEFFNMMKRRQAERLERMKSVEEQKRFILRCASNGGMQHQSRRKNMKVSLPKLSILEKKP